VKHLINSAHLK